MEEERRWYVGIDWARQEPRQSPGLFVHHREDRRITVLLVGFQHATAAASGIGAHFAKREC